MKTTAAALLCAAAITTLTATHALAQTYPVQPMRIFQGFAPGGNADTIARIIGQELSRTMGQPVIVETRAGAGGNLAAEAVAKAAPDGYSMLLLTGGHPVAGALYKTTPFHPVTSFEMISTLTQFPFLLVVRPDGRLRTLAAFMDAVRAAPNAVSYGSAGLGSTHHLTGELIASLSNTKPLHVPYKGDAAAMTALLGGQIDSVIATPTAAVNHIRAGKAVAIGVTSRIRWPALPDVPAIAENTIPGFEVTSWLGLGAPAGTPRPIIDRLNKEAQAALTVPEVRARIESLGGQVQGSTPEELRTRVASEFERWTKVIADAKIERQ